MVRPSGQVDASKQVNKKCSQRNIEIAAGVEELGDERQRKDEDSG